jgi:hypothetical protein
MDEDYLPILVTYDELTDMWSFYVGDEVGVADTKQELLEKIWSLIREWEAKGE